MPTPQFETIQSKLQENSLSFNEACLQVFQFQAENNPVYKAFLAYLGVLPANILNYTAIPFLPIQFFKSKTVTCFESVWAEKVYLSSASSGGIQSKHFVKHYADYQQSFTKAFELFYGNPADYCVIALLPSYLEREGSSLIDMAEELIKLSNNPHSGFYLNDYQALIKVLSALYQQGKKNLGNWGNFCPTRFS